tara:strand:+ start:1820 stop:1960 length:141 start_codon:yes stop_codon:yes gene_type:complete
MLSETKRKKWLSILKRDKITHRNVREFNEVVSNYKRMTPDWREATD